MEFDMTQLVSSIGIPGAMCFLFMQLFAKRQTEDSAAIRKALENNTKVLYLIAGKQGINMGQEDEAIAK